ncbi:hypothetical protein ACFOVU_10210 [Nocardiopsis sediminis]|uniref:Uncharacterized protein n=1 Tax=Nocardiopsis sediminis TaxID=1778267 RepID=A0ABV8FLN5_9ACTN
MTDEPFHDPELETLFSSAGDELTELWRARLSRRLLEEAGQGDTAAQEIVAALRLGL